MSTPPASSVVRLQGVGLHYGKVEALAGINLEVPTGCMVGLIGPDGVPFRIAGLLPPRFALDELRIKTSAQYGSYITGTNAQADIPATARVIPWPNY